MPVTVRDDPQRERYVAELDGEWAGYAAYRRQPGVIAFMHTEVDPRFDGRAAFSL